MANNACILSVSQLNLYVKSILDGDDNLSQVYLEGEISNLTNHYRSGHMYMTIKDDSSAIKAVMFRMNAQRLRFMPENGMKVLVRGRVSLYERDGQYQLYIDGMQPSGAGALSMAFERLKSKLEAMGYFDAAHKKILPQFPKNIGIVTSATGAAIEDIKNIAFRRFPGINLILYPVLVQGESAAPQIAEAIDYFSENPTLADVLIVGRGGGSAEVLWAFNEECVARAIYECKVPVISAVGHETDFTISDFVADLRAPTPSAAAELAVPEQSELMSRLYGYCMRCASAVRRNTAFERSRLSVSQAILKSRSPMAMISEKKRNLAALSSAALNQTEKILYGENKKLASVAAKLDALSPLKSLSRGYSIVTDENGAVIKDSGELSVGDKINVKMFHGSARCTVDSAE